MRQYSLHKPASESLPRNLDAVIAAFQSRSGSDADSVSTSPITAQRLTPDVLEVFVKNFPLYELVEKVPANGISHTFLQQTAYSANNTPATLGETGTVNDDANQYLRKTTNIPLFGVRRGVSLKAQYAGQAAGGASSDLMAREVAGGLTKIARSVQDEFLSYQESDPSSTTATAANGIYDVNGMNGLRYTMQNLAPPENNAVVDIRTTGWTDQRVLVAVRAVCNAILDKGGNPDLIVCSYVGSEAMFLDQMQLTRYIKEPGMREIAPGQNVRVIETEAGPVPVLPVPGTSIGSWVDSNPFTYVDIFVLDTETIEAPYLGAPEPTILRIPLGVDGSIRELAIPFLLMGLACKAPQFLGRVSLRIA